MKKISVVFVFNSIKTLIGSLLTPEKTPEQKKELTLAWEDWSLVDRVSRQRSIKRLKENFPSESKEVVEKMVEFNRF